MTILPAAIATRPYEYVHPNYTKYTVQNKKIRDTVEGSDAVKAAKAEYLPRLTGQSDDEYNAYRQRALFMNIAARIINTNLGMITRRSPVITLPEQMKKYFTDTLNVTSFKEVSRFLISEILQMGRVGVYLDVIDGVPTVVKFPTESIRNWMMSNGVLTDLVLYSESSDPGDMSHTVVGTYYWLKVRSEIFIVEEYVGKDFVRATIPEIKGKPLNYIPFFAVNPFALDIEPCKSPMIDVVEINLSHYRTSADLEHGRHFTALPTPVITGGKPDSKIHIGSTQALIIPNDKAKAFYMEFLGQGLQSLENALKEKQAQMAQFSARLMDTSARGSEAEGTVRLRHAADAATLYDITAAAESALNAIYKTITIWEGIDPEEVSIELNKDFLETKLAPAELKEVTAAYIAGAIDEETFYYNIQRGEITPPGHTKDKLPTLPDPNKADGTKSQGNQSPAQP